MVFNSFAYLLFFPTIVALYFIAPQKWRWMVILFGSYFFYMSWKPAYGALLFLTTLLDWALALCMIRAPSPKKKKIYLIASIGINLAILFFFKYFNFFSFSLFPLFGATPVFFDVILPIGISFYTFQSLAYMVDVYRGDLPAEKSFFRYATFVSFFPHLVSGPILRPANILPQVHEEKNWNADNVRIGLYLIAIGLIKKVVIADRLGVFVNQVYLEPSQYSGATLLLATYFFAFQIYCDFSGYTDIAIGSARILGFTIPDNFRQPYFSQSISEFWRRWHISLSSWLRDYLYIPLGGNRKGAVRTYVNLCITMLLGGIWHGASWTFVAWGAIHGIYLAVERSLFHVTTWGTSELQNSRTVSLLKILLTFNLISFGWIFFRAANMHDALEVIRGIVTRFGSLDPILPYTTILLYGALIGLLIGYDYLQMKKDIMSKIIALPWYIRWGLSYGVIFGLIFFAAQVSVQFIYFQF